MHPPPSHKGHKYNTPGIVGYPPSHSFWWRCKCSSCKCTCAAVYNPLNTHWWESSHEFFCMCTLGEGAPTLGQDSEVSETSSYILGYLRHTENAGGYDMGPMWHSCHSVIAAGGQIGYPKTSQVTLDTYIYATETKLCSLPTCISIYVQMDCDQP